DVVGHAVIGAMAPVVIADVMVRTVVAVGAAAPGVLRAGARIVGARAAVAVLAGVIVADVVSGASLGRGRLAVVIVRVVLRTLRPSATRVVRVLGLVTRAAHVIGAGRAGRGRCRCRRAGGVVVGGRGHHVGGPSDEDADQDGQQRLR